MKKEIGLTKEIFEQLVEAENLLIDIFENKTLPNDDLDSLDVILKAIQTAKKFHT